MASEILGLNSSSFLWVPYLAFLSLGFIPLEGAEWCPCWIAEVWGGGRLKILWKCMTECHVKLSSMTENDGLGEMKWNLLGVNCSVVPSIRYARPHHVSLCSLRPGTQAGVHYLQVSTVVFFLTRESDKLKVQGPEGEWLVPWLFTHLPFRRWLLYCLKYNLQ